VSPPVPAESSPNGRGAPDSASAELWRRLARPFRVAETVDALFGFPHEMVVELEAIVLCTSPEARGLLAQMPVLVRSLTTSVSRAAIRSRGEIRGPVLWSETISARAATYGDDDLFVCTTPQRDYDTAQNRVLVNALSRMAEAGKAIEHLHQSRYDDGMLHAARAYARRARLFLDHPALASVSRDRVAPRMLKRVRGAKSAERYHPAMRLLERAGETLGVGELLPFCDRRTQLQHAMLLAIIHELERRHMRMPALRVESGALLAGPLTYIHPRRYGSGDRLHGILVGDVLIDVPEHVHDPRRDEEQVALEARSHGRPALVVIDPFEAPQAVDLAVRDARARLAQQRAELAARR
jgi:hypothetical protein